MLRLRHFRHPVRAARSLYWRAQHYLLQRRAKPQFNAIRRGTVDACWCGGALLPFAWHESYRVCAECGTYVNTRPPLAEEMARLYSIDLYWRTRQRLKGFPTIEDRARLYDSDGRVDRWLELIDRFGPASGTVVEVGCAPGVLLSRLAERGYDCTGLEISADVASWIQEQTGVPVLSGFFPGVPIPECDVFLAFDVIEHSPCPQRFLAAAAGALRPGGMAMIQTVVDRYDLEPPFGSRFDVFDDLEHLYLFTDTAMERMARAAGLEVVEMGESLWVAGEIVVLRKPAPAA